MKTLPNSFSKILLLVNLTLKYNEIGPFLTYNPFFDVFNKILFS